jgi:organic hydroperoxide reductase OsmC/OhrA
VLQGTSRGESVGFEIKLTVQTGAEVNAMQRVLEAAHATCYTEDCLRGEVPLQVTHEVNGRSLGPTSAL